MNTQTRFGLSFILVVSTFSGACAAPISSSSSDDEVEGSVPKSSEISDMRTSAKKIYFGKTADLCIESCETQSCVDGCIGAFCPGPAHQCI